MDKNKIDNRISQLEKQLESLHDETTSLKKEIKIVLLEISKIYGGDSTNKKPSIKSWVKKDVGGPGRN